MAATWTPLVQQSCLSIYINKRCSSTHTRTLEAVQGTHNRGRDTHHLHSPHEEDLYLHSPHVCMSETSTSALSYRERLTRLYRVYAPSKIPNVDSALFAYHGREEEMMRVATTKYGPEPSELFYELVLNSGSSASGEVSDPPGAPAAGGCEERPSSSTAREKRSEYSERLMWLFVTYCPEKMLLFDDVLYAYRSDPRQMITDFVAEFGPEPQIDYRKQRLKRFYEYYCPEKVVSVEQILLAYAAEPEEKLFDDLKRKYGPEPSPYCTGTSESDKQQQEMRHRIGQAQLQSGLGVEETRTEPLLLSRDHTESFTRSRLVDFYTHYCPQKLPLIDDILETYRMHPRGVRQLFYQLEEKYGPEPCRISSHTPEFGSENVSMFSGEKQSDRCSTMSDVATMLTPRHHNHHHPDPMMPQRAPISAKPEDLPALADRLFRMVLFYDASRLPDLYAIMPFLTAVDAAQQLQVWIQHYGPEPSESALMDVHRLVASKESAELTIRRVYNASMRSSSAASPTTLLHAQHSFQRGGDSTTSMPTSIMGGYHHVQAADRSTDSRVSPQDPPIGPAFVSAPLVPLCPSPGAGSESSSMMHVSTGISAGVGVLRVTVTPPCDPSGSSPVVNHCVSPRRHHLMAPTPCLAMPNPFPYALYLSALSAGVSQAFFEWYESSSPSFDEGEGVVDDHSPPEGAATLRHLVGLIAASSNQGGLGVEAQAYNGGRQFPNSGLKAALDNEKTSTPVHVAAHTICPWRHMAEPLDSIAIFPFSPLRHDWVPVELRAQSLADVVAFVRPYWLEHAVTVIRQLSDALHSSACATPTTTTSGQCSQGGLLEEEQLLGGLIRGDSGLLSMVSSCVKNLLHLPGHHLNIADAQSTTSNNDQPHTACGVSYLGTMMSHQIASHAVRFLASIHLLEEVERIYRYVGGATRESGDEATRMTGCESLNHLISISEQEEREFRGLRRAFVGGILDAVRLEHLGRLMNAEVIIREGIASEEEFQRSGVHLSWNRCVYLTSAVPEGSPWRWSAADSVVGCSEQGDSIGMDGASVWQYRCQLASIVDGQWSAFTKPIFHPTKECKMQLQLRTPRKVTSHRGSSPQADASRQQSCPPKALKGSVSSLMRSDLVGAASNAASVDATRGACLDPRVVRYRNTKKNSCKQTDASASAETPRQRCVSTPRDRCPSPSQNPYQPFSFAGTLRSEHTTHSPKSMSASVRRTSAHSKPKDITSPSSDVQALRGSSSREPLRQDEHRATKQNLPLMKSSTVSRGHFSLFSNFSVSSSS